MQTKFVNFKKRDKKGRRLSIFAEYNPQVDNDLLILVFTCSLDDQFSRKEAYNYYEKWKQFPSVAKPQQFLTPVLENKPLKSFIEWCNDNYYVYEEALVEAIVPVVFKYNREGEITGIHQVGKVKTV